jgi:hypothetical protein
MIRLSQKPTHDGRAIRLVLKNVVDIGDGPAPPAAGRQGNSRGEDHANAIPE